MSRCVICKKELPEGTKVPVCEYHRAQVLGTGALAVKAVAPKVVPVIKKKGPEVAKAAINIAKTVIRK